MPEAALMASAIEYARLSIPWATYRPPVVAGAAAAQPRAKPTGRLHSFNAAYSAV